MATMYLAMWLQESDAASNRHLIMILILIMTVAIVGMALLLLAFSLKAFKAIQELTATASEMKAKALPLLDEVSAFSKSGRELLEDAAPKVKLITDSLVKTTGTLAETTQLAKSTVQKIETTVSDANMRTQRQVARVDGMVTAALNTTAEIVEAINHGIRVPAQKIAVMATQAKAALEGLLEKIRSRAGATRQDPNRP